MKQEDHLREALSQLAREEADQLESSLTREERRRAEKMYQRHRRRVFSLIGKNSRKKDRGVVFLRVAAVLAVLLGAAYLFTRQTPPDHKIEIPLSQVSVAPYRTDAPTESPTITPTFSPIPTLIPTETSTFTPEQTHFEESIPTSSPSPTPEPTPEPTATAAPTLAPTPESTAQPTAEPTAQPAPKWTDAEAPSGWSGSFFPALLPDGSTLAAAENRDGVRLVTYACDAGEITFAEYDAVTAVTVNRITTVNYAQLGDDLVGLQSTENGYTTISWDIGGQSLSLTAPDALALEIAQSVRKIK